LFVVNSKAKEQQSNPKANERALSLVLCASFTSEAQQQDDPAYRKKHAPACATHSNIAQQHTKAMCIQTPVTFICLSRSHKTRRKANKDRKASRNR